MYSFPDTSVQNNPHPFWLEAQTLACAHALEINLGKQRGKKNGNAVFTTRHVGPQHAFGDGSAILAIGGAWRAITFQNNAKCKNT